MSATCMTRVQMWLDNAWYGHVFAWSFLAKFVLLTEGHLSSMWQCNIRNIMTFLHMVFNETEGLKVSFSIHVDTYLSMIDIIELPCIHVWVSLLLPTSSTLWNENTKIHHRQYKSRTDTRNCFQCCVSFCEKKLGLKKEFQSGLLKCNYILDCISISKSIAWWSYKCCQYMKQVFKILMHFKIVSYCIRELFVSFWEDQSNETVRSDKLVAF